MISNEYGMSCDLQSAIALYVAGKLFVKVKESDDIESIDDGYTSVSCRLYDTYRHAVPKQNH